MKADRRLSVRAVALIAAVAAGAGVAEGATVRYRPDADLIRLAERVVRGRVIDVRQEEDARGAVHTIATLQVLEDYSGRAEAVVEIRELGGIANGRFLRVDGAVRYEAGSEIVVLLERSRGGDLRSMALGLSKFDVVAGAGGEATLVRSLAGLAIVGGGTVERMIPLAAFRAQAAKIRGVAPVRHTPGAAIPVDNTGSATQSFTLLRFGNGLPARWTEPDSGVAVRWYRDNTARAPLTSGASGDTEIQTAISAWTGRSEASLRLTYIGTTTQRPYGPWTSLGGSGAGVVFFEDPYDEIAGNVLAIGGGGGTLNDGGTVNGTEFNRLTYGFVIMQNAADLPPNFRESRDLTRVLQHEIGHAVGLGHTQTDGSVTSPTSNIMYPSCCSSLTPLPPAVGSDDLAALSFVYPPAASCTFSISPQAGQVSSAGGSIAVNVTTQSGCAWSAATGANWVSISGTSPRTGSGSVTLSAAANTSTSPRTAAVEIATRAFTLSQPGAPVSTGPQGGGTDFDGDGHIDLLWHHQGNGNIAAWMMQSTTLVHGTELYPSQVSNVNWKVAGTGDLDGDGHSDLVWQNTADGRVSAWLMDGLNLRLGESLSIPQVADTAWRIRSVGDADNDGRADLYWQHEADGRLAVWLMNGFTVREGIHFSQVSDTSWKVAGTGDFDRDGQRDLLWHHQGDGRIAIWRMNGLRQLSGAATTPGQVADLTWQIRAVGDLNGDGYADIVWQNTADGRISVWFMRGLTLLEGTLLNPSTVPDTNWWIVGPR